MKAMFIGLALAGPAAAFENDYAALMRDRAAEVQEAQPGLRRLELPGPVIVEERRQADGSLVYSGRDLSGFVAAGCGLAQLVDAVLLAGRCPAVMSEADRARLEGTLAELARFVGENAYPPVPEDKVRPKLVALMLARSVTAELTGTAACPEEGGTQDAAEIARNLARPGGQSAIWRMMGFPRLPVEAPCP